MLKHLIILSTCFTCLVQAKTYYKPERKDFPCIADVQCESLDEMDPTLAVISVTYFDDVGTQYHWTQQLHRFEDLTDCDAAMADKFPYPFFNRCNTPDPL